MNWPTFVRINCRTGRVGPRNYFLNLKLVRKFSANSGSALCNRLFRTSKAPNLRSDPESGLCPIRTKVGQFLYENTYLLNRYPYTGLDIHISTVSGHASNTTITEPALTETRYL